MLALRAIDVGLKLLRIVQTLPHERHLITAVNLPIYSDEDAKVLRDNVTGIQVAAVENDGTEKLRQLFPTTKTHFQSGQFVSWEWNMQSVWEESFYRDPESNEVKQAWWSAAEFVGRPLDEL